jgi:hypothetical protein
MDGTDKQFVTIVPDTTGEGIAAIGTDSADTLDESDGYH